jgi:hypothetical protein
LPRRVHGKRIVFEGVELRHDAEPRGLRKGWEHRRPTEHTGEPSQAGDADHGRDKHDAIGPRQGLVAEAIERIFHRQRPAVGKTDQLQR